MSVVYRNPKLGSQATPEQLANAKKTANDFAQTEGFKQKYGGMGAYYLNFLQKAVRDNASARFYLPGGVTGKGPDLYFGSRGPQGQDYLQGEFGNLEKDYSSWIANMTKTNEEYSNYVKQTQNNPGRDQTILGTQGDQPMGDTLLGSRASTVFG